MPAAESSQLKQVVKIFAYGLLSVEVHAKPHALGLDKTPSANPVPRVTTVWRHL
jgi:hypothetical protein